MLVLMGVMALLIGVFSKTGFFTIIGPVAIVISMFIKVTTPEYKRWMVNHKNKGAFWTDITKIEYDLEKRLVRLHYTFDTTEEEINYQLSLPNVLGVITSGECDLFMTKENEQQVFMVLKQYLPHLAIETTSLELPDNDN